jgi:peptidoglycan/xylan/chitin deacetylase (PgdA/CDA1 family)
MYGCKGTLGIWKKDRHPDVLYSFDTDQMVVALTIDDGPDPLSTRLILDSLAENEATATFFIITDRIPGNEDLLKEMVSSGHELGNHLTRDEPSINLDPPVFESELIRSQALLSEFSETDWFRPGSGRYDDWMLEILKKHDYHCVLGTIYPLDAQITSSWFAKKVILWNVKPGAIIILHDAGSRGVRTARLLADVLPELRKKGYRIVNLTELQSMETKQQ